MFPYWLHRRLSIDASIAVNPKRFSLKDPTSSRFRMKLDASSLALAISGIMPEETAPPKQSISLP
jgi:hypothetical protein